jgi:DNA repair protein RecN (Recombination protein N)
MLAHIHIQNYILVKNLSIDFEKGLNILTGETGAGKSLWMDAVLIALGAKTDASVIRHDADTCSITVTFDIQDNHAAKAYLQEHDFAQDGLCIIRRILYRNKAGKTTLNDHPCTLQNLKNLAPLLLSIHGQHHHQSLLQTDAHRKMLDCYADNFVLLNQMDSLVSKYHLNQKDIDQLTQKSHTQSDEMALLQFHYEEIKALHLQPNTWQMINEKHQTLHHAQSLIENMTLAEQLFHSGKQSMIEQIEQVQKYVNKAFVFDKKLQTIITILSEAHINISEAVSEIHHYCTQLDTDPKSLETIENQLSAMHTLARKHRIEPSSLMDFQNELENKMNKLENLDTRIYELKSEQKKLQEQYQTLAEQLSTKRKKASRKLEALLTADMQMLGMEGGVFCIATETHDQGVHRFGQETIVFKVSTNPGQPIKPLQDIVSGGELSRLSLALHRHLAEKNQQPTLIFDEVDAGIGGTTADKVGALLKDLSKRYQILCITHLPQIACLADQHCLAEKQSTKDDTQTMMKTLNHQERIEELSRMLGGVHITQSIKDHAEHLLNG